MTSFFRFPASFSCWIWCCSSNSKHPYEKSSVQKINILKVWIWRKWCFGINSSSQKGLSHQTPWKSSEFEVCINFRFPVMYWNRKWFTLNICCVNNCQDSYCGFPIRSSPLFLKFYCVFSRHCVAFVSRSFVLVDAFGDVLVALRSYPLIQIFHFGPFWLFLNIPVWW